MQHTHTCIYCAPTKTVKHEVGHWVYSCHWNTGQAVRAVKTIILQQICGSLQICCAASTESNELKPHFYILTWILSVFFSPLGREFLVSTEYLDTLEKSIPKLRLLQPNSKSHQIINIHSNQNTIESDVFTLKFYSKNINKTGCWLEIVNATQLPVNLGQSKQYHKLITSYCQF